MSERPKILFVTSHWPAAPAYGAQQRVLNIARLLGRFGDVSFVIVPTEREDDETARKTMSEFDVRRVIRPAEEARPKGVIGRIRHEFDPLYMVADPYIVKAGDREFTQELIGQFDVVWVHTIRTANWFRFLRWPHSVLDLDDLPSRTYRSSARSRPSKVRRLLDLRMAWIWKRRELRFRDRFDVLVACSEDDRRYLGGSSQIQVIPNGAEIQPEQRRALPESPRIGFIGNCTFEPNEGGVKWFVSQVWPRIKREFPCAQFRLVGRGSAGYLTNLGQDITGLGWLEDPGDEIATWSVMVVPIRVGGGTRVKTADGFARRCPIVATSIGAFGYDIENGKQAFVEDSAEEFASACILLLKDPALRKAVSDRAYDYFLARWKWDSFATTVGAAVQECLDRQNRPGS